MSWNFKDTKPAGQQPRPALDLDTLFKREPSDWDKHLADQRAKRNEPEELQKRAVAAWNSTGMRSKRGQ